MTCMHDRCQAPAKWAPKISVPAKGWPIDMHRPPFVIMGLELCEKHFAVLNINDLLDEKIKDVFEKLLVGKCPPDFERAFLSCVSLNSPEYKKFLDLKNQS